MEFTWRKLEEFVQSLTEEQKDTPVVLIDWDNEIMSVVTDGNFVETAFYATYDGLLSEENIKDEYSEEDGTDLIADSYLTITKGNPYLDIN